MKLRDLITQVSQELRELVERHQLRMIGETKDASGVQVTLANEHAALRIRWEWRERRLFLSVFRLDRGAVPTYWDVENRIRDPLNGFDADDIIVARCAHLKVEQGDIGTQEALARYQTALSCAGAEIFNGDYAVFSDAAQVVMRRIEQLEHEGLSIGPDGQAFKRAAAAAGNA